MADFYLKSGSAVERANDAAKVLGDKIVILRGDTTANYLVVRKWIMECTTAGTTGAAVPAWPAAVAAADTLVDGTVTWTFRKPGFSSGTTANWAFSAIFLDYVVAALAAGDRLWVSHLHAESVLAATVSTVAGTLVAPTQILCGNDAAAPPTALATSAVVETGNGAAYNLAVNGIFYCYGVSFKVAVGNTANTNILYLANAQGNQQTYDNCAFEVATTFASSACRINVGNDGAGNATPGVEWKNCTVKFGAVLNNISISWADFSWIGGSILTGSAAITTIFKTTGTARVANVLVDGVDFSNAATGVNLVDVGNISGSDYVFRHCKLPATWSGALTTGAFAARGQRVSMYNCDSADTNYRLWIETYAGSIKSETTIVRTSGASDGTTALAWNMTTSANASYPLLPLESDEIAIWNDTTASAKTLTIDIIHDSLTALNDDEVWLEVQYLGTAGFPLGSFISDAKANVLATAAAQTASTATWTTTGLTNPNKQKLAVTFTPQEKGYYIARVKLAKPSYTIYVDPLVTVA